MKKIVSLILAATMSTTVLSGCVMSGANEPDENSDANVSEISTVNESEKEVNDFIEGVSEADCWKSFFEKNPYTCYNDILDWMKY